MPHIANILNPYSLLLRKNGVENILNSMITSEEIKPSNMGEILRGLATLPSASSLKFMLKFIEATYVFLDKIPPHDKKEAQEYRQAQENFKEMIRSEKILSQKKIYIGGQKTLLIAKLYTDYLEMLTKIEPSLDKQTKTKAQKILLALRNKIKESPFNKEKIPTTRAITDMINFHERRLQERIPSQYEPKVEEALALLERNDTQEIEQATSKIFRALEIESLSALEAIIKYSQNYFHTKNNDDKNEVLKTLLFKKDPVGYRLLDRCKQLNKLFESFAFIDPSVSMYFNYPDLSTDEDERELLLSLIREKDIELKFLLGSFSADINKNYDNNYDVDNLDNHDNISEISMDENDFILEEDSSDDSFDIPCAGESYLSRKKPLAEVDISKNKMISLHPIKSFLSFCLHGKTSSTKQSKIVPVNDHLDKPANTILSSVAGS